MRCLDLHGNLQTNLRIHKNKYTFKSQLQSHIDEHSDLTKFRG